MSPRSVAHLKLLAFSDKLLQRRLSFRIRTLFQRKHVAEANAPMLADLAKRHLTLFEHFHKERTRHIKKVGRLLGG